MSKRSYLETVLGNPAIPTNLIPASYASALMSGGHEKLRKTDHAQPTDPTPAYQPWKKVRNAARADKAHQQDEYSILRDNPANYNRFEHLDDDADLDTLERDYPSPPPSVRPFQSTRHPSVGAYEPGSFNYPAYSPPSPAPSPFIEAPSPTRPIDHSTILERINRPPTAAQHEFQGEAVDSGDGSGGGGSGGGDGDHEMNPTQTEHPSRVSSPTNGGGEKPSARRRGGHDDEEEDRPQSLSISVIRPDGPALDVGECFAVKRDPEIPEFVHHADPYGILALAGHDLQEAVKFVDNNDTQFLLVHLDRVKIKPSELAAAREDMRINLARAFQGQGDILKRAAFGTPFESKVVTVFPVHNLLSNEFTFLNENVVVITDLRVSKAGFLVFRNGEETKGPTLIGTLNNTSPAASRAKIFRHAERVISGVDFVRRTVLSDKSDEAIKKFFDDNLIVECLDIEDRKKSPAPVWNIYLDLGHPDITARAQKDIRLAILAANWDSDAYLGLKLILEIKWMCTRCTGRDHPAGMCPFMKMKGWPGALQLEEMQKAQKIAASRAKGTATVADAFIHPARTTSQKFDGSKEKSKGKKPFSKKA
ncbi:hypothetical protein PENSPDRAFT_694814 [Peniophora sp. CONT]|nr:hypothetical protein PENSPDRAFT_694814 [Peniophora sp. CONT]